MYRLGLSNGGWQIVRECLPNNKSHAITIDRCQLVEPHIKLLAVKSRETYESDFRKYFNNYANNFFGAQGAWWRRGYDTCVIDGRSVKKFSVGKLAIIENLTVTMETFWWL